MIYNLKTVIGVMAFGLAMPSAGFSKPIEDGSSFTGLYRVREEACAKKVFNYQNGKHDLVSEFSFEGTPAGLKVDGLLQPIRNGDLEGAEPNSGGTVRSGYLSATEFFLEAVFHFEVSGLPVTWLSKSYKLDSSGVLTETSLRSRSDQSVIDNRVCHFVRVNE